MQIMKDMIGFISGLKGIDVLLYFAILVLIILIVSLIYIIKTGDEVEQLDMTEGKDTEDLQSIVSTIEKNEPPTIELTDYEAEQEEKAIISYDELLEKNKLGSIHYAEEKVSNADISIKKIDLESLMEKPTYNKQTVFYNYEREEEFLKCLKALSKILD